MTYRLSMPARHVLDIGEQISSNPGRPSSIFPNITIRQANPIPDLAFQNVPTFAIVFGSAIFVLCLFGIAIIIRYLTEDE
jgi:hypothetical protein